VQRQKGNGLVLVEPKSRAGARTLVLPATLLERLHAHRRWRAGQRLAAGPAWHELDFVFAQPDGRPIGAPTDWKAWKALLADAGVRPERLHDARRTTATLLLQQGVLAEGRHAVAGPLADR